MDKEYLEKLQNTLIEILDYVCKVCEDNNLRYFLSYGTALGAYRHGGFIPWDDDIDIVMPRNDYEKLEKILNNINSDKYSYQNENNEKNYFLLFAKVRKNNTTFIESKVETQYKNNGIFIDIIPLDYVKNKGAIKFKIKLKLIQYIRHLLKFKNNNKMYKDEQSKLKYICNLIISFPSFILNNNILFKVEKWLMTTNGDENNSNDWAAFSNDQLNSVVSGKDIYLPGKKMKFENKEYIVPSRIEEYLENYYGSDYMKLPPEEKRQAHFPKEVKF